MATTRDYTDYLNDQVDIAPVNSQEELQAAELIESLFAQHGLETELQEFDTPSMAGASKSVYFILLFIGMVLAGFIGSNVISIVGFAIVAASFLLIVLASRGIDVLASLGPRAHSQNVIGVHRATGPNVVKGSRPIVIVAHYDTPHENFAYGPSLAKWLPLIKRLDFALAIVVLIFAILQLPPIIPSIMRHALWVLGVLAALPLLLLGASSIYERFAPCTTGANDNKASVAAMLGVLDMVRPGPDDAKQWAATHPRGVRRPISDEYALDEEDLWQDQEGEESYDEEPLEDDGAYTSIDQFYDDQEEVEPVPQERSTKKDEPASDYADLDEYFEDEAVIGDETYLDESATYGSPIEDSDNYYEEETHQDASVAPIARRAFKKPSGVRRGANVLRSLEVLPETCEIEYVNLAPRAEMEARLQAGQIVSGEEGGQPEGSGTFRDTAGKLSEGIGSGFSKIGQELSSLWSRLVAFFVHLFKRDRVEDGMTESFDKLPGDEEALGDEAYVEDEYLSDEDAFEEDGLYDEELVEEEEQYDEYEDGQYAGDEYADDEYAGDEYADDEYADDEYADDEYVEEEYAEDEYEDGQYAEDEYIEEEYAEEEYSDEEEAPAAYDECAEDEYVTATDEVLPSAEEAVAPDEPYDVASTAEEPADAYYDEPATLWHPEEVVTREEFSAQVDNIYKSVVEPEDDFSSEASVEPANDEAYVETPSPEYYEEDAYAESVSYQDEETYGNVPVYGEESYEDQGATQYDDEYDDGSVDVEDEGEGHAYTWVEPEVAPAYRDAAYGRRLWQLPKIVVLDAEYEILDDNDEIVEVWDEDIVENDVQDECFEDEYDEPQDDYSDDQDDGGYAGSYPRATDAVSYEDTYQGAYEDTAEEDYLSRSTANRFASAAVDAFADTVGSGYAGATPVSSYEMPEVEQYSSEVAPPQTGNVESTYRAPVVVEPEPTYRAPEVVEAEPAYQAPVSEEGYFTSDATPEIADLEAPFEDTSREDVYTDVAEEEAVITNAAAYAAPSAEDYAEEFVDAPADAEQDVQPRAEVVAQPYEAEVTAEPAYVDENPVYEQDVYEKEIESAAPDTADTMPVMESVPVEVVDIPSLVPGLDTTGPFPIIGTPRANQRRRQWRPEPAPAVEDVQQEVVAEASAIDARPSAQEPAFVAEEEVRQGQDDAPVADGQIAEERAADEVVSDADDADDALEGFVLEWFPEDSQAEPAEEPAAADQAAVAEDSYEAERIEETAESVAAVDASGSVPEPVEELVAAAEEAPARDAWSQEEDQGADDGDELEEEDGFTIIPPLPDIEPAPVPLINTIDDIDEPEDEPVRLWVPAADEDDEVAEDVSEEDPTLSFEPLSDETVRAASEAAAVAAETYDAEASIADDEVVVEVAEPNVEPVFELTTEEAVEPLAEVFEPELGFDAPSVEEDVEESVSYAEADARDEMPWNEPTADVMEDAEAPAVLEEPVFEAAEIEQVETKDVFEALEVSIEEQPVVESAPVEMPEPDDGVVDAPTVGFSRNAWEPEGFEEEVVDEQPMEPAWGDIAAERAETLADVWREDEPREEAAVVIEAPSVFEAPAIPADFMELDEPEFETAVEFEHPAEFEPEVEFEAAVAEASEMPVAPSIETEASVEPELMDEPEPESAMVVVSTVEPEPPFEPDYVGVSERAQEAEPESVRAFEPQYAEACVAAPEPVAESAFGFEPQEVFEPEQAPVFEPAQEPEPESLFEQPSEPAYPSEPVVEFEEALEPEPAPEPYYEAQTVAEPAPEPVFEPQSTPEQVAVLEPPFEQPSESAYPSEPVVEFEEALEPEPAPEPYYEAQTVAEPAPEPEVNLGSTIDFEPELSALSDFPVAETPAVPTMEPVHDGEDIDEPMEQEPAKAAEAPHDANATVFMTAAQIAEGLVFSAEQDAPEEDLLTKDVTGLDMIPPESVAAVEDTLPPVDQNIPKPRAVDDPDWGTTTFRPQGISVGRRAMLLDLPDPSVISVDPLRSDAETEYEEMLHDQKSDTGGMRRIDLIGRVPSPLDAPTDPSMLRSSDPRASLANLPSFDDEEDQAVETQDSTHRDPQGSSGVTAREPEEQELPRYNHGNTSAPQSKKPGPFRMRFGRRRHTEEQEGESLSEWLGVESDYDAKKDGRKIGSWDHFDDDDSRGKWKGGATVRAGLRDDEDDGSLAAVPGFESFTEEEGYADNGQEQWETAGQDPEMMEDLREAVLQLGDDDLIAHDIWFVGVGASGLNHAGVEEFLEAHRRDFRGAFFINLDSIGAGNLTLLTREGTGNKRRADRRIVRMFNSIANALHIDLGRADYSWSTTDATPAMQLSVRVATLMGMSRDGVPALSHTASDEPEHLNDHQIADVADMIAELIRRS